MKEQERIIELLGRADIPIERVLLIAEVGSTAHGMSVNKQDDLDLTVVRVETFPELVVGDSSRGSMMIRTAQGNSRSMPGDIDLNVYTLRKFASLIAVGNPSILGAIYSPIRYVDAGVDWDELNSITATVHAGQAFLGYMEQQISRWTNNVKKPSRPELVEAHGYDTKYAAHAIRLGYQGIEFMQTGRYSMPLQKEQGAFLRNVRRGEVPEEEAFEAANWVKASLQSAVIESNLPAKKSDNWKVWVVERYREFQKLVPNPSYNPFIDTDGFEYHEVIK